jgi:2-keto-4-pentenoate hydratase/2-oxohepta-3-ene-1,7-dioic acid hydratase in catechol pathway
MKIICVGRNYVAHAKELNNEVPENPVLFMKPNTALLKGNAPFYHPDWSKDIHYETELVLKISKQGKYIAEKFAHKYYEEITVGIDFTARDLQNYQKQKGLPWEIAKAFDGSAPVGEFVKIAQLKNPGNIHFSMKKNNIEVQNGNTENMIYNFDKLIAYMSQFFTLQVGDLIFTGTPAGVGPVAIGDTITCFLEDTAVLNFEVK